MLLPESTFQPILKILNEIAMIPPYTEEDLTLKDVFDAFAQTPNSEGKKLITKAYNVASGAHSSQLRVSGKPYIQHCLATAQILAGIGMDTRTVAAGLLHDVPEDTTMTLVEIEKMFGADIANMIEGITKLGKVKLRENMTDEHQIENWQRMFLAMGDDIRTVIIKMADRLHNMRTLKYLKPEKRIRIANETMEIYVPIANRLGIGDLRAKLAEHSFKHLEPEEYKKTKEISERVLSEKGTYVEDMIATVKQELKEKKIRFLDVHGRTKGIYSLHLKIKKHEGDVSRICDVIAIRIIVSDIASCYEALGIVHKKYRPMAGRIKDYISLPKPNGYQSLHTTVFGTDGQIIEIQIRTQQMHDEAEFGIAAHWLYEQRKKSSWRNYLSPQKESRDISKEVEWAKQLGEWQKDIGHNPDEFLEGLKVDFLKNHIFAFTPQGSVIELPEGASAIDFAYAIHTDIGNTASGALIDGKMSPLNTVVSNAQVIKINTDKNRTPNPDWLQFVKTSHAKQAIRRAVKEKQERLSRKK